MPGWMKWTIALLIGFAIIAAGFRLSWGGWILRPFFILNCLVLIIVVLLQSGKAADLAGAFGGMGSQTAFGPRGSATLLSRATTFSAVAFMVSGPATKLTNLGAVKIILGVRNFGLYIAFCLVMAVISGLAVDGLASLVGWRPGP